LSDTGPPRLPRTRLSRAWLPALRTEVDRRRRRQRRLRLVVVGLVTLNLVALAVVVLVAVGVDEGSRPGRVRLPSFVTGPRRGLEPAFVRAANESRVPVGLVMALAWRESEWQEGEVSSAGAVGIGQLLPATSVFARDLLHDPRLDPRRAADNIRLTARYLRALIDELGGSERLGVGAYLQGSTSVRAQGLTAETTAYVDQVESLRRAFDRARRRR
jgi:soluble lytic murein transglycosylase-like protein